MTEISFHTFDSCHALQSINIPKSVTKILFDSFSNCTSLRSVYIPNTVTCIGDRAFKNCTSLISVSIPSSVTEISSLSEPFQNCQVLQQRSTNGINYHESTVRWLKRRFVDLPIHQACYEANNDATWTIDSFTTLIEQHQTTLTLKDAMGMTPLHILSCNPNVTAKIMQTMINALSPPPPTAFETEEIVTHSDGYVPQSPVMLFLQCRSFLGNDLHQIESVDETEETPLKPSLVDLIEKGMSSEELEIVYMLNQNEEAIDFDFLKRDDNSGLLPFMSAASSSKCGLDVVYMLAVNVSGVYY